MSNVGGRGHHPAGVAPMPVRSFAGPLPVDWSPIELWTAAGLDTTVQRSVDEFHERSGCGHSPDECEHDFTRGEDEIRTAIENERTLSKVARRRILEALEIEA